SLEELLRALRDGAFLSDDQKLLLVMDQFEQVLASENSADWCRMRDALRQFDGLRLQAVVMTRSDFQEAASLFFEGLGQKLNENTNSVTLRLFEPEHARHVLHLLGLALGRLPEQINAGSSQAQFLDEAIGGLSQNGRVNSVRLAVFAELLKNREWQPGTLRVIGGVRGVGVTFLEESFAVADAPLTHRRHLEAVRRVLKFLLPAVDSEIVGAVQSTSELRRVAGYDQRASDFESLIQILDTELRLITPIDLTKNSAATGETASDQRF
ncbi:MAG: serine/threonine protein kinase, partial [Planctomyces sp.]